jgi:demethylmenaquinone methyltransferase/2-methoxy-6-polyprenyl-1,4-benzoquinol methylase
MSAPDKVTATPDKSPDRIAGMFDAIAPRYDLLNRTLSLGIDRRWRRRAIASLGLRGTETLLDVCTGTADVALEGRRRGGAARVVGVDFAGAMLALGRRKVREAGEDACIVLVRGDAAGLPVADGAVHAVTVAFGIRNVQRTEAACAEMARALVPGGRLAILEFGMPRIPGVRHVYEWYFRRLLPWVGRAVSGHTGAYAYLPASVGAFPPPDAFMTILRQAGFADVRAVPLTFGIVYLYTATRAADPA